MRHRVINILYSSNPKKLVRPLTSLIVGCFAVFPVGAAEKSRQIEEVIVTAEKVQSTVSDTSISITAFNNEMIEDFGMQGADDMVNFIPATTRDAYDIRIRGVGRNFRALGGDPGVATYYNGVFSPDFGIAASENALWDLARIEVLRGPQGTLYGRNAVGGALNYVTNEPTSEWTGKIRTQLGNLNAREVYGVVSGPLTDSVDIRLLGITRKRDGAEEGIAGTQDTNSVDDRNYAISLTWDITDSITFKTRANDRASDRIINAASLVTEGAAPVRGIRSTNVYAYGLTPVSATDPGAMAFTDPADGSTVYGAYVRPGLDIAATHIPNGAYGQTNSAPLLAGATKDDPNNLSIVNNDGPGDCHFEYTLRNCQHEYFGHRSDQTDITWDISDRTSLKYIFGYTDFKYTFNIDSDYANSDFNKSRTLVLEDVQNKSHELQLFWGLGEKWTATSGAFWYDEIRQQDYSLTDTIPRYTGAVDYGALDFDIGGGASYMGFIGFGPTATHTRLFDAPVGFGTAGRWEGDTRGDWYHHFNTVHNTATALYTQGTYQFNDRWDLVLGIRYAKDKKRADEVRTGYLEVSAADLGALDGLLGALTGGLPTDATTGLTRLGLLNIAMGNATYSGDPANPLTLTCALTATNCDHPIRLQGIPISYSGNIHGEDEWSDTNYRINLDWTPDDNTLMYFSVTTGYRAGGYSLGITGARVTDSTGAEVPATYDKETVTSFELGYKGQLVDNTLQLNMAAYTYRYKNYQDNVDGYDTVTATSSNVVTNAPRAINSGFEVEALWLATDTVTVGGNYSLTKTKYDADYEVTVTDDPSLPTSVLGSVTARPDLYVVNVKGSQLKKIPENKATLWASYLWSSGIGDVTFRGNYSYTGKYYDQGFERELDLVPSRFRMDLSATWQDASRHWTVRGFVDNVTDEKNLRDITTAPESSNWRLSGAILYPRFFGIDVTYDFTPL